jgi:subtilase family serine protease
LVMAKASPPPGLPLPGGGARQEKVVEIIDSGSPFARVAVGGASMLRAKDENQAAQATPEGSGKRVACVRARR